MTVLVMGFLFKEAVALGIFLGSLVFFHHKYQIVKKVREEQKHIATFEKVLRDSERYKTHSKEEVLSQFNKFKG